MFLLILCDSITDDDYTPEFTFQYVSINTARLCWSHWKEFNLHSNMFLLIQFIDKLDTMSMCIYIPICFY